MPKTISTPSASSERRTASAPFTPPLRHELDVGADAGMQAEHDVHEVAGRRGRPAAPQVGGCGRRRQRVRSTARSSVGRRRARRGPRAEQQRRRRAASRSGSATPWPAMSGARAVRSARTRRPVLREPPGRRRSVVVLVAGAASSLEQLGVRRLRDDHVRTRSGVVHQRAEAPCAAAAGSTSTPRVPVGLHVDDRVPRVAVTDGCDPAAALARRASNARSTTSGSTSRRRAG